MEIYLPCLHTFKPSSGLSFPTLHSPWPRCGAQLSFCTGCGVKSVCEGAIIHHHSSWDLPTSWLGTSTFLYFSSQIFSGGGHWGCSQWCSWGLHQLPLDCHPLHREQALSLRPGWGGQQVLPAAWYISTQGQGENK